MLKPVTGDNAVDLYRYCAENSVDVPFCFDTGFSCWQKSMFHDVDYDGTPLFSHLETYSLVNEGRIEGFIQFGLTNFSFDKDGKKDGEGSYAIIRNLHCMPAAENAGLLMDKAGTFFDAVNPPQRHAFFHYFGMGCFARQGKLHASQFYMEPLLHAYGYGKAHENVYYTKDLRQEQLFDVPDILFSCRNGGQTIDFLLAGEKIGGCDVNTGFHANISFLKYIYIAPRYAHQGLGTKCMNKLCWHLRQKGFIRLDTDTADNNLNAQGYYIKTGFTDQGRMRSYCTR